MSKSNVVPLAWGAILLFVFLYAANPALYFFTNDDFDHIPLSARKVFGQSYLYRPLAEYSLYLDHLLWGKKSYGYHLTNTVIHLLNTVLVFLTARLLTKQFSRGQINKPHEVGYLSAFLFLVYPFHVEAIFWIIGRGASLGCTCCLLAVTGYLWRDQRKIGLPLSFAAFAAGLFIYETVFVVPLMLTILYVFERTSSRIKRSGFIIILYWFVFAGFLSYRYFLSGSSLSAYEARNFLQYDLLKLFYNLNTLLARSFLPPFTSGRWFLATYGILVIVGVLAWRFLHGVRRVQFLLLPALLYLVSLIPVLSVGIDTHDTEGDRFLYLPSAFLMVCCGGLLIRLTFLKMRYAAIAVISGFFIIYFLHFSRQYQFAALVVRRSLERLDENASYRNIYAFQLPAQYKGALIFRSGFENALRWKCPGVKFEKLHILSRQEIRAAPVNFSTAELSFPDGKKLFSGQFSAGEDSLYIPALNRSVAFRKGRDLFLFWTDSSMVRMQ